jgi:hypothetical protein
VTDEIFARLRALNPGVVDAAKVIAASAVAAMPRDLQPQEEPAHIYQAAVPGADCTDGADKPEGGS